MVMEIRTSPTGEEVASFLEIGSDELAERDRRQRPIGRWLAAEGQALIGLATAFVWPDDRLHLTHRLNSEIAFEPLLNAAVDELDRTIHLGIPHGQDHRVRSAKQAGFVSEMSSLSFDVPFQAALQKTTGHKSTRIDIVRADHVSPDDLFALDTDLRQDVPGIDGWRGNRAWFDDEMASADFDPTAYLVARDRNSGDLVGLCRFWSSRRVPALGLIGVRSSHRTGRPALNLLHETMLAASRWGSDTFSTNTARPSLQRRLRAVGATQTGGFTRLRRPA